MKNGPYELVLAPTEYPGFRYRGKYVYEHHLVWWRATGALVPAGHLIHHKNGKKRDNRIQNLELQTRSEHTAEHTMERTPKVALLCGHCGKQFKLTPSRLRERWSRVLRGKLFCSRSCGMMTNKNALSGS